MYSGQLPLSLKAYQFMTLTIERLHKVELRPTLKTSKNRLQYISVKPDGYYKTVLNGFQYISPLPKVIMLQHQPGEQRTF